MEPTSSLFWVEVDSGESADVDAGLQLQRTTPSRMTEIGFMRKKRDLFKFENVLHVIETGGFVLQPKRGANGTRGEGHAG